MKAKIEINAVGNEVAKTYDIIKTSNDGGKTIYRTTELSEQEFEDMEYNTPNDWQNFLNTSQDYYLVK